MKNNKIQIFVYALLSGMIWTSCDRVDENLKITSEQDVPIIEDTLFFVDSVFIDQKQVLLEDFTGHKCVNCPEATVTAHDWIEDYDHRLILLAIHAGFLATPDPSGEYTTDFTCPVGDEIFFYFNEPINPTATINRVEYDGLLVMPFLLGNWDDAIENELAKPNEIDMSVKTTYFPNQEGFFIDVTSTPLASMPGKYKLVLHLAEDNIVAPQKNSVEAVGPVPDWLDYTHHNVLRDAINGTFGEDLGEDGAIESGTTYYNRFFYSTSGIEWEISNLRVITYIYRDETDEIVQVTEVGVKTTE